MNAEGKSKDISTSAYIRWKNMVSFEEHILKVSEQKMIYRYNQKIYKKLIRYFDLYFPTDISDIILNFIGF